MLIVAVCYLYFCFVHSVFMCVCVCIFLYEEVFSTGLEPFLSPFPPDNTNTTTEEMQPCRLNSISKKSFIKADLAIYGLVFGVSG